MRWLALSRTCVLVLISVTACSAQAAGDAARGADIFKQNCSMCHCPEPGQNLVGPSLFSVVGRAAGSLGDFSYSSALKGSGITWTTDRLKAYLKAPRKYIPGVKMMFPGLTDEQDRDHVVAFLATLSKAGGSSATAQQAKSGE